MLDIAREVQLLQTLFMIHAIIFRIVLDDISVTIRLMGGLLDQALYLYKVFEMSLSCTLRNINDFFALWVVVVILN